MARLNGFTSISALGVATRSGGFYVRSKRFFASLHDSIRLRMTTLSRFGRALILLVMASIAVSLPASAQQDATAPPEGQTQVYVGPRLGFDLGDVEELFVGVDARIHNTAFPIVVQPALDIYLQEGSSLIQLNVNALYPFAIEDVGFQPYAGGGLGFSFVNDRSDVGLNVVGGALFESDSPITPFAQAQITVGDIDFFALSGGILLRLTSL